MITGKLISGMDERVPVLFSGPEGCRVAPRNSTLRPGEVIVDHCGLELHVRMDEIVKASVVVPIIDVESLGPSIETELYTTWQGKKYRMIEVTKDLPKPQSNEPIKQTFNLP